MTPSSQEITRWLVAWSQGDKAALDHLLPLIYTELHRMAQRYMGGENPGHPLQTTALIHEAYLRLIDQKERPWQNRARRRRRPRTLRHRRPSRLGFLSVQG